MTARKYSSTAEAKTLSTAINNSATSIVLNSVTTLPSSYPYTLVIDPDTAYEEIITVTASGGGNILTVVRGQDGTGAQSHTSAAVIRHMITARDLQDVQNHIEATSGGYAITNDGVESTQNLHGIASGEGVVVGTDKTQTLTLKTLTAPVITNPTITGTITGSVVTSANIVDGTITSADIADGTIVNGDINASAAIVATKLTGTTAEFNTALSDNDFATLAGTETLTNKTLTAPTITSPTISGTITGAVVTSANIVDATITGTDIASGTITSTNIFDGTILNADINASAAIDSTKISGTAVTLTGTETLTNKTLTSPTITGSGFDAWTSYTPTIGGTGWVLNNATVTGLYCQFGKTVHFVIRVVFGSTSTFGAGRPTLSLPVTATSAAGNFDFVTNVAYFDNSATLRYLGAADFSTTNVDLFVWGASGTYVSSLGVTSAVPFTWATGDVIYVAGTYEAA